MCKDVVESRNESLHNVTVACFFVLFHAHMCASAGIQGKSIIKAKVSTKSSNFRSFVELEWEIKGSCISDPGDGISSGILVFHTRFLTFVSL